MYSKDFIKKFKQATREIIEQISEIRGKVENLTETVEKINNWFKLAFENIKGEIDG